MITSRCCRSPGPDRRHLHQPAPRADQRAHRPQRRADRRRRARRGDRGDRRRSRRWPASGRRYFELADRGRLPVVRRRRRRRRRGRGRAARPVGRHQRRRRPGRGGHQRRARPHRVRRADCAPTSPTRRPASSSRAASLVLGETDPELAPIFRRASGRRASASATSTSRASDNDARRRRAAARPAHARRDVPRACSSRCTARIRATTPRSRSPRPRRSSARPLRPERRRHGVRATSRCRAGSRSSDRHPLVVLDGAHNAGGRRRRRDGGRRGVRSAVGERIFVVGLLRGRDPAAMLEALDAQSARLVIAAAPPTSPRDPGPEEIAARGGIARHRRSGRSTDVRAAVDRALDVALPDDLVLVTGSLYVVGAARSRLVA